MAKDEEILQLEALFNKWQEGLVYFANQYLKNSDESIEIVNDAFMAIWERRETLKLDDSIKGYIYTTVRNKCLNAIKKVNPEQYAEDVQEISRSSEYNIQHNLEAEETEGKLNRAIEALPPRCKEIFLLSRKEGMSYKEIAKTVDVSTKTVENQIGIALKQLKVVMFGKSKPQQ